MNFTAEWFKAALARALRTAAQVALGMFTIGMTLYEVNWMEVVSVAAVAAVYSLLTSMVTGLPEVEKNTPLLPDGSLTIDESDPDVYGMFINLGNKTIDEIAEKKQIVLNVETGTIPEPKPPEEQSEG